MLLTGNNDGLEAKSGYGLNLEDEVKQLEVLREAQRCSIRSASTCMATRPHEFRSSSRRTGRNTSTSSSTGSSPR